MSLISTKSYDLKTLLPLLVVSLDRRTNHSTYPPHTPLTHGMRSLSLSLSLLSLVISQLSLQVCRYVHVYLPCPVLTKAVMRSASIEIATAADDDDDDAGSTLS